jgi:asparagine synthase (glutamine-hydrolysing)
LEVPVCGIAGAWGEQDPAIVRAMVKKLAHRGPDAAGVHIEPATGALGHRRLSIIDPERGNQPIYNEDRSKAIVANSEAYNFRELREELRGDHSFRTRSDTEVILHLFEEFGPSMVRRLDGMFALSIADGGDLFLARDPLGIKPLYYGLREKTRGQQTLFFASEIKALLDFEVQIREFPPGTCFDSRRGLIPYYIPPSRQPRPFSTEALCRILRLILEEAVVKRLVSDVPLGVFLSGGVDSSIIAALAARHLRPLHTFAVGTRGSSDLEAARIVARHIGSIHHECVLGTEAISQELSRILYHLESFDRDLVRSAIPCYFCARLASDHVKVVLTGEGADELFAGYSYYRSIREPDVLHDELRRSVMALHNVNLQRVDRMTMAHGLEGRVPFLDLAMVDLALVIRPELKLYRGSAGTIVDKWILRKAFESLLPEEIIWRDKEQFDEGSGTLEILGDLLDRESETWDAAEYARLNGRDLLRSDEEALYHKTLVKVLGPSRGLLDNVARWKIGPDAENTPGDD